MIRFIDGFGMPRIFCKNCKGSFLESFVVNFNFEQKNLRDYLNFIHDNPRAIKL